MIAASRRTFEQYGINDRVTLIEGPAAESSVNINLLGFYLFSCRVLMLN